VAAAYRDTEAKVKAALQPPQPRVPPSPNAMRTFFGVFLDPRAYLSIFYMLLALVTGVAYFVFVVLGLSLSAGFAFLIIGVPFFLAFIAMSRVISLGEGRLLEAVSGERMPRRPPHPGPPAGWWSRIGAMLSDAQTWTTLAYLVVMLPLGVAYFCIAVIGLSFGVSCTVAPIVDALQHIGLVRDDVSVYGAAMPHWLASPIGGVLLFILGIVVLTTLMHSARNRPHAREAREGSAGQASVNIRARLSRHVFLRVPGAFRGAPRRWGRRGGQCRRRMRGDVAVCRPRRCDTTRCGGIVSHRRRHCDTSGRGGNATCHPRCIYRRSTRLPARRQWVSAREDPRRRQSGSRLAQRGDAMRRRGAPQ